MTQEPHTFTLSPEMFAKPDPSPDTHFYAMPRFVTHIDDQAIAALTGLYRDLFPANGSLLDLMSSWVSHLPDDVTYTQVVGHGMNAQELAANPRLTSFFIQDLNIETALPYPSHQFDGAALCVSIQYLQNPIEVLTEAARLLKPGAPLIVSFSNRCFPTKAVALWQATDDHDHVKLVAYYLQQAGFTDIAAHVLRPPTGTFDPLWAVLGRAPAG